MLHGLATWGLSTLFVVLFLMTVFGSLLGSTLNALGYGAAAVAPQVAQSGTATSAPISAEDIRVLINQLISEGSSDWLVSPRGIKKLELRENAAILNSYAPAV